MPRSNAEKEARYNNARKAGKPVVVSEGDSWFAYPICENIIDILDDTSRFAIKRLEYSGDTVANMVGHDANSNGINSLKNVVENERPRFLLFSGGGNDIVGDEFTGALRNYDSTQAAAWHLETDQWANLKKGLEDGYRILIETIGPLCSVFAHGYDYIFPANKPVRYDGIHLAGPWVWKEMHNKQIPDPLMINIAHLMIDWFNDLLQRMEDDYGGKGYLGYLDLRNTLATPDLWANEIHPTEKGFEMVTDKFIDQLDSKLQSVLTVHDSLHLGIGVK